MTDWADEKARELLPCWQPTLINCACTSCAVRPAVASALREATSVIGLCAIPLEALRAVEMDSHWMAPAVKRAIVKATDAARALLATRKEGE